LGIGPKGEHPLKRGKVTRKGKNLLGIWVSSGHDASKKEGPRRKTLKRRSSTKQPEENVTVSEVARRGIEETYPPTPKNFELKGKWVKWGGAKKYRNKSCAPNYF